MSFQALLAASPADVQKEITEMDAFMKSLRPLKFKRTADKRKINYISSDYGISYGILPTDPNPTQQFGWYICDRVTKVWYRKTDYFVETLAEIANDKPATAKRIYDAVNICTPCKETPCAAIPYSYSGEDKTACYGRIVLPLGQGDFTDVRVFFQCLNALMEKR